MSKINMGAGKFSFSSIIDFFFGTKTRMIITITSLSVIILSAIFIPLTIHWIKESNKVPPKEKITININVLVNGDQDESLSNIAVYKNNTNERIYLSTQGSFSINNYDHSFEKDDLLRIERVEYHLTTNGQQQGDVRTDGENILILVTENQTINLLATKILTPEEEELLKSVQLEFVDKNGAKIIQNIKAMEKNTIPTDPESGELDYESEEINILGTTQTSKMTIRIDDNQINNLTLFFYSLDYDFEDLDITNQHQNQKLTVVGTYKQEKMEIMNLDNVSFTLKFETKNSSGNTIYQDLVDPKAKVSYYFYNLKNNGEIVKGKIDVEEDKNTRIYFKEGSNYMFEYMIVNVELNNRYYVATCYPTPKELAINAILKEGYKVTAKYSSNAMIEVSNGTQTHVVPCDNSGIFSYIATDLTNLSFKNHSTGEVLSLVRMDVNSQNVEEILILSNKNFIYNEAMNNLVLLPQASVAND
ncbi:MAG: hypothetical protein IJW82_00865 [Clostridia bacterium]|nr:hypothetical protein [Clostridia bacterium]